MKPLLLTMQAFGPFAAHESIDFTALGSNPLFLINGATGAGKSTILDAICFSLYGQTTGAEREPAQMRCDFAEAALLTEVSLEFSLADKRYRVRRVPQQQRPKKSGEGSTNHVAESQLWELDGSEKGKLLVSKSVTEATQVIKELIGLDVEQFRQVMVLPQGKFRELLLANSTDRQKIFSQLFQAENYKRIEELLKHKASGIKQAVENHRNQIRGILQAADVASETAVSEEVAALSPLLEHALQTKAAAEQAKNVSEAAKGNAEQLIERFDNLQKKQQSLAALLEQQPVINQQQLNLDHAVMAQKIQPLFAQVQSERTSLNKLQHNLLTSERAVKAAKQREREAAHTLVQAKTAAGELVQLNKQLSELERLEKHIADLQQAQQRLAAADAALAESKAELTAKQNQQQALNDELSASEQSSQSLLNELEALADKQITLQKLQVQLEQRKELEALRRQGVEQAEQQQRCQQQLAENESAFSAATTRAMQTELSWHNSQAALLAKELEENQPCPVCGSEQHPQPATMAGDAALVSKDDVDHTRAAETKARAVMDHSKKALDQTANELTQTHKECQRLQDQLQQLAGQPLAALKQTVAKTEQAVTALRHQQDQLKKLQQRIEVIKAELAALKIAHDALDKQTNKHHEQAVKARTAADLLEASVPPALRAKGALSKQLNTLQARIVQLTQAQANAETVQAAARSEADKSSSHYAALATQTQEQQTKTEQVTATWQQALVSSAFSGEAEFQSALLDENAQAVLHSTIERHRSEQLALQGVIEQMQSDLADKVKPDLAALEQTLQEKTLLYQQADKAWREQEERNNQLKAVQKKLAQAHKKHEALEAEYKVIGTLSEVANGQTGNKISLQRFVLSVLLDDVLIQASQRLLQMSKGRYQLVRNEDRSKGNKASGLELEVEDGYSGKIRSVATLSGGESFLAALSLALGLSDVVQSYAGGIKLDTLFIDEGFGSLDPESLDLAIRTLIDLQAAGRMIGIISHVTELKEQMALRVDVISDRLGSHIATVAT